MSALEDALTANREAAKKFLATARELAKEKWAEPIAPGKRSPAQIVDHLAVSAEVQLKAILGDKSMGSIPSFLRPLPRALIFKPVLKKGVFPEKTRAPAVFDSSKEHLSYDFSAARLERAIADLESHVREMAKHGKDAFDHGFFGRLSIVDYLRFNTLHTAHHEKQLR